MKSRAKTLILTAILFFGLSVIISNNSYCQAQPSPGLQGLGRNQGAMALAPIGDSAWILVALVIGYGVHSLRNRKKDITD